MGGGATKPAAAANSAVEAQHLINEIDNSSSILHLNVHTTFIVGIISLVILIVLVLLLPCLCCKNIGIMCRWCCAGRSATEMQQPAPITLRGGWAQHASWPITQRQLEAAYVPHQQPLGPKGTTTLSHPPASLRTRPTSEPTWSGERLYPSVTLAAPPNSQESSTEDF